MWPDSVGPGGDAGNEKRPSTSSEVAIHTLDGRLAAAVREAAPPANLNINKSSKVHVGPKLVTVTQHIQSNDVVKGRLLCLELVSPSQSRRLRCSVAIFVCWALVVAAGLAVYLFRFAIHQTRLDIGLNEQWYLRRGDWQALDAYHVDFLDLPLKYVIVGHSVYGYCNERFSCIEQMMSIQQNHLKRRSDDIVPNFLVSGNGFVFEGRGANVEAAMVKSWNKKSMTVMFLGDYRYMVDIPDDEQINHVKTLLNVLVRDGVLVDDYVLYGYCQVVTLTVSPGLEIMERLHEFKHWDPANANTCRNETKR